MYTSVRLTDLESCRLDDLADQLAQEFQREFPRLRVVGLRAEVQILAPTQAEVEARQGRRGSATQEATGDVLPLRRQSRGRLGHLDRSSRQNGDGDPGAVA